MLLHTYIYIYIYAPGFILRFLVSVPLYMCVYIYIYIIFPFLFCMLLFSLFMYVSLFRYFINNEGLDVYLCLLRFRSLIVLFI